MDNESIKREAKSMGYRVRPTRTNETYVFFVWKNDNLLFDGQALYRDEVVNWLKIQVKS